MVVIRHQGQVVCISEFLHGIRHHRLPADEVKYAMNNSGLSTLPCLSPILTSNSSEDPSTTTIVVVFSHVPLICFIQYLYKYAHCTFQQLTEDAKPKQNIRRGLIKIAL